MRYESCGTTQPPRQRDDDATPRSTRGGRRYVRSSRLEHTTLTELNAIAAPACGGCVGVCACVRVCAVCVCVCV